MNPCEEYELLLSARLDGALSLKEEAELHAARKMGRPGLKLIHGYGSSGTGGKIRTACRKYLRREAEAGRVRLVIRGEDFSIFSEETRRSFTLCAQLRADRDLERQNKDVTIVIL